jgi:hypothetical protein
MAGIEFGLGRFGDRRLEKGGPCCMRPFMSDARLVFGGSVAADREKFSLRVSCATKR